MINEAFFFLTQFSLLFLHQNWFRLGLALLLLHPDMSRLNRICLMVVKRRDLFHCSKWDTHATQESAVGVSGAPAP